MLREIVLIAAALGQLHPAMSLTEREAIARVVYTESKRSKVEWQLGVALVEEESEWRPGAINPSSNAIGYGQILLGNEPECRNELELDDPGAECSVAKQRLLDGAYNLRRMFGALSQWRKLCRTKTGKAGPREILEGYGGMSVPEEGQWCGRRKVKGRWVTVPSSARVELVLRIRRNLLAGGRRLVAQPRHKFSNKPRPRQVGRGVTTGRSHRRR